MTKILHFFLAALLCCASSFSASAQDADVTTALDADFTQFTEGTPDSPVAFPSYGSGSFTSFFPSWFVSKVSKAGGAVLVEDGGYMQTPYLALNAHGGVAKITIRVKAMDAYGCGVKASIGYSSANSATTYIYDNEWHDVSMIVSGGASSSHVRIEPYLAASGILIESIKIEQSANFFAAPVASQPSQADGTSFTATWSNVSGTTHYYLDVYSYNSSSEKVFVIENEDCGTLRSKKVTGLTKGVTYYYVVRASNGTATSENSNEIEVVPVVTSIDAPEVSDATVSNGKATISWQPVENAVSYIVNIFRHTTLTEDTEVAMLKDDFSKVTIGSLGSIEFTYNYKLDQYTSVPGWDGAELGLAEGNIVLTPFGTSEGNLITPLLDLSANDGNLSVVINMTGGAYGSYYGGAPVIVKLLDEEGEELESETVTLKKGYNDYTFNFTKGTSACKVGIYYPAADYKLFISNISVNQLKKAGSVIKELATDDTTDDTTYTFDYTAEDNVKVSYMVYAVGRTVSEGSIADIVSDPSAEKFVTDLAAIGSVGNDNVASVRAAGAGSIEVTTMQPVAVKVYDLNGRLILSTTAEAGTSVIDCHTSGIVIVSIDGKTFKLVI